MPFFPGNYVQNTPVGMQALDTQRVPALRTFHAALANRFYAPVKIAAMGASKMEGQGASSYSRGWLNQWVNKLRAQHPVAGVAGGFGYISGWSASQGSTFSDYPSTLSGGAVADPSNVRWAGKAVDLTAAGNKITVAVSGTSAQVVYAQFSGGGTFNIDVDGGAPTLIDNNNAVLDRHKVAAFPAFGARGAHTLHITWASGSCFPGGVMVFDQDEAAGINLWNGGHAGLTSADYLAFSANWQYGITYIQPHLVVIELGENDYLNGTVSAAQAGANLLSTISTIRANCSSNPSIVLVEVPVLGTPPGPGDPWALYQAQFASIAQADPGVLLFSMSQRMYAPSVNNALSLWQGDFIHWTDKGHGLVADELADFVSPR